MPREWGKTLSSHISEPPVTYEDNSHFWEHLNKAKMEVQHRKYGTSDNKSTWKRIKDILFILASMVAFVYAASRLNPFG